MIDFFDYNIRLLFQNVNGLVSKRSLLINSNLLYNCDLALFQETNFSDNHVDFDNFKSIGFSSISLSTTSSGKYSRGSTFLYRDSLGLSKPEIISNTRLA